MLDGQRNRRFWLDTALIFIAWTAFALILANQFYFQAEMRGRSPSWAVALRSSLLEAYLWAVPTVGIFWLARRFPLERGRMRSSVAVHAAGAVALLLVRVFALAELSRWLDWIAERPFSSIFWGASTQHILYYALLLGIAHAVMYRERYRERERAAELLAAGLAEARLQALKRQLQPHFLFNTLNAVSALIPADAKPARRMVARLGDLLRISLEHEETQEVTLREELAFLEPYVEIEQARLANRLTVEMDIAPSALDVRVPHLLLQPLVENAIRHGIAPRIAPGRVEIAAACDANERCLRLEVRDDGPGLGRETLGTRGNGVGLRNIKARLEQLYGAAQRFEIGDRPGGGVVVQVTLPLRRAGDETMHGTRADR